MPALRICFRHRGQLAFQDASDHCLTYVQNGASFLGNITSILQSQQAEVAGLLQGPTPTPTPQPGLPLPNIGRRLQQVQVQV